jgi:hypothetical protein
MWLEGSVGGSVGLCVRISDGALVGRPCSWQSAHETHTQARRVLSTESALKYTDSPPYQHSASSRGTTGQDRQQHRATARVAPTNLLLQVMVDLKPKASGNICHLSNKSSPAVGLIWASGALRREISMNTQTHPLNAERDLLHEACVGALRGVL